VGGVKNCALMACLILLSGCGQESTPPSSTRVGYAYPALNESSLPPAPPRIGAEEAYDSNTHASEPPPAPAEIRASSGLQMELDKQELIKDLRDYATRAAPDDPFALTEAEIEAISKLDNPMFQ